MMGQQDREQGQLFYEFRLDDVIPRNHLLRRMNVFVTPALADLHQQLKPFCNEIGRPSVDDCASRTMFHELESVFICSSLINGRQRALGEPLSSDSGQEVRILLA